MTDRELMQQALECTPHKQLIDELLDSRIPKTEREHAAAREIEKLRERLAQPDQDYSLIQAAPDLLEALQGLLKGIFDGPDEANAAMLVAKARDAVNKATGEK